jgi:hypothetical protein
MNKIIEYWPFTSLYPLKRRIATKNNCISFGAATILREQGALKSVLN